MVSPFSAGASSCRCLAASTPKGTVISSLGALWGKWISRGCPTGWSRQIRPPAGDDDPLDETWVSPMWFDHYFIPFNSIAVPAGPPCNPEKVRLIAESLKVTGLPTPLTVRQLSDLLKLLSNPCRLKARKKRGMDACECVVLQVDETDGRLWQIAELLHQPKLRPLDWAELVMEWVHLVREKDGRVTHPVGGRQPRDRGLAKAERVLGVSRRAIGVSEEIVSISDAGKAEIRRLGLRVKRDLVKVAKLLSDDEQVAMVQRLAGPKVRP